MILVDMQIIMAEEGFIKPLNPKRVSSMGYDLSLGYEFKVPVTDTEEQIIDPFNPPKFQDKYCSDYIVIPPQGFILGTSIERLEIPIDVLGICLGRSTYARAGIITHVTPLEPGWRGNVTIEISNTNPLPVKVWCNRGITQVIFLRSDMLPLLDYAAKGGRYQDQTGVTQGKSDEEQDNG